MDSSKRRTGHSGPVLGVVPLVVMTVAASILSGCATSLPMQVQHLPEWNTGSVKKVAVVPFKDSDGSALQKQTASDLTSRASQAIGGLSNFEIVAVESIQGKLNSGQDITMDVDALFEGQVLSATTKDSSKQEDYTEVQKDGSKVTKKRTRYYREVEIKITFKLDRARDRSVIGQKNETWKGSANSLVQVELPSATELVGQILDGNFNYVRGESAFSQPVKVAVFGNLNRILAPWSETVKVTLEKETSKDKAVKASMKEAEKAVKAGSLKEAQAIYSQVYKDSKSFAAGYNAAILTEALDGAEAAIPVMQGVADDSGNPKAQSALARMKSSVASAAAVADFQANQDSALNKSIKQATGGILSAASSKFPSGTKVAIMKSAGGDGQQGELLDYVVSTVTESLMSSNLTVVERGANAAIIDAEKDYQLSGNVSDNEIVSIGNEYGAGVIIFLSITGSGGRRSLKVEAVNVETKERIYQETFEI